TTVPKTSPTGIIGAWPPFHGMLKTPPIPPSIASCLSTAVASRARSDCTEAKTPDTLAFFSRMLSKTSMLAESLLTAIKLLELELNAGNMREYPRREAEVCPELG